jgi:crossover junction endodeoxyribonuclease RuvC
VTLELIVGVDPGLSGAIALVDLDGQLIDAYDMPVVDGLVSSALLATYEGWRTTPYRFHAVIEDVHSMPRQGVASTFTFGRAVGAVEATFGVLGVPVTRVAPTKWKKAYGLGKDKGESRRRAIELWPDNARLFARVKDDGRAEAALIALWYVKENGK